MFLLFSAVLSFFFGLYSLLSAHRFTTMGSKGNAVFVQLGFVVLQSVIFSFSLDSYLKEF